MRLHEELRWNAGVLGEVRDAQVMYRRLTGMIAELDDSTRLGTGAGPRRCSPAWPNRQVLAGVG